MPKTFGKRSNLKAKVWLGIDQSYSGFAMTLVDEDDNFYTEVHKLDGAGVHRLIQVSDLIEEFIKGFRVQETAMEGYAFASQMAHMAGELGAAVKLSLFHLLYNTPAQYPLIVAPTSLKKYITGKGTKVQKNMILLNVYKKWGVEFTDDNAADSYGLARIARNKHDFEYEKEVYDKVTSPGK